MKGYYFIAKKSTRKTLYIPQYAVLNWFPPREGTRTNDFQDIPGVMSVRVLKSELEVDVDISDPKLERYEKILDAYYGKGDKDFTAVVKDETERVEEVELPDSEVEMLVASESTRLKATEDSRATSKSLVEKISVNF
jgi:hypothetical protein